ncbi:DUF3168 domain-containing protein [Maritalea sp.]|jgi:hypothetical protein|uniref:DUF3168 domain-containing protein n=1 Tax=Maritalea sp. TaxID=2003361 RepID=UPI0039E55F38
MNSAMKILQTALVSALASDPELTSLIGVNRIFDAPPKGVRPPYVVIARHDANRRDAQATTLSTHLIDWHIWLSQPHRSDGLVIADRLCAVVLSNTAMAGDVKLVMTRHVRTESSIDKRNGWTRILVRTQFNLDFSQE